MDKKGKRDIGFEDPPSTLGDVRHFLLNPFQEPINPDLPLWWGSMRSHQWDALLEWINSSFPLDGRTLAGEGWLHLCAKECVPNSLAIAGLRRLDATWADADASGKSPLHLPVDLPLAQAMAVRWWAERRDWSALDGPLSLVEAAKAAGREDLVRHWNLWQKTP